MSAISRYIFRTTFGAFLLILVSLTATIWVTQALRDVDLMTSQRQTIMTFIGITGMIIPLLVLVIAPIALVAAVAHVLNRLSADSEIIVMNAAGMSPWRLFRPFLAVAAVTSVMVIFISAYLAPLGMRELKRSIMEVRANLITTIVQPGRFVSLGAGLTFHIRERRVGGKLGGVFLDDRRNPQERVTVLAEEGELVRTERGLFLVLQKGNVQRFEHDRPDPTIVVFERYAFDLSQFERTPIIQYNFREHFLWQLAFPEQELTPAQRNAIRAELHDRLMAPLYPVAFVIIAYAYLGAPRTTRQSRSLSLLGAIGMVALVRLSGFVSTTVGAQVPAVLLVQYVAVALAIALGLLAIGKGVIIEPPAFINNAIAVVVERIGRRLARPAAAPS